jgi:cytidylate kinase
MMSTKQLFSVAIDGPCGAGKSTIARALARQAGALYLDTGAMYRAVGLAALRQDIPLSNEAAVTRLCDELQVDVRYEAGEQHIYLGDEDVSEQIRAPEISAAASRVSAYPGVRRRLVDMQRAIGRGCSIVMDGRDIGTKVLPDATLKIYLLADPAVRARRRYLELQQKGLPDTYEMVYQALLARDHDDMTRAASPLARAEDAIELDTTHLNLEESVSRALELLSHRLEGRI